MERIFHAEQSVVDKYQSRKSVEVLQIILYSFLLFILLIFGTKDDSVRSLARSLDMSRDSVKTWVGILIALLIGFLILSIALAILANSKLKLYASSFVQLTDTGVKGTCFPYKEATEGTPFFVEYSKIDSVTGMPGDGLNLRIQAGTQEYQCLAIHDANQVAALIQSRLSETKRSTPGDPAAAAEEGPWKCACGRENPAYAYSCACGIRKLDLKGKLQETQKPRPRLMWNGQNAVFCKQCGAAAPEDAIYCPKCGEKIKQ